MITAPSPAQEAVGYHDAECAAYQADQPFWLALADTTVGPILDVGAGTGRTSIPLALAGHDVTALDLEPALLDELQVRAAQAGTTVRTVAADMRSPAAAAHERGGYGLIIVPMQTVQLLPTAADRAQSFRALRELAAPGGELVLSVVPVVEPFDSRVMPEFQLPEDLAQHQDWTFASRAVAVLQDTPGARIDMHRERQARGSDGVPTAPPAPICIQLSAITLEGLQVEAAAAGWEPVEVLPLPETEEHAGSVMLTFVRAEQEPGA